MEGHKKPVTLLDFLHLKTEERKERLEEKREVEAKMETQAPRIFTVQGLTRYIKERLDMDTVLRDIYVRGEISNLSQPTSGHLFFTIKDELAELQCVMFREKNMKLSFIPEDGMKVVLRGYISVYEKRGRYQLYVEEIQEEGIGALYASFEQLKRKLKKEGLFDVVHKKPLPIFLRRIGIITSPTSAAIRDMLNIIKRRFPYVHILIAPVAVQGEEATSQVADAIRLMNKVNEKTMKIDVIIVGRGGGSLEELWAFNEEIVARAIFSSEIPIISAVGHETDFTIADFVADKRAATPSEAAEIVVPDKKEIMKNLMSLEARMIQDVLKFVDLHKKKLEGVKKSIVFKRPLEGINLRRQELDDIKRKLHAEISHHLALRKERLRAIISRINALSPLAILDRGYAICSRLPEGRIIRSAKDIEVGDMFRMLLKDGEATSEVKEKKMKR